MIVSNLPTTMDVVSSLSRHEKNIIQDEKKEALKAAEEAAKNNPEVQEWLKQNRHLWQ